jgi:1,2-phenylacetyl-CoA epoxidase catalytic subunit
MAGASTGSSTGTSTGASTEALDARVAEAVAALAGHLAAAKERLGLLYAGTCLGGPTVEASVALAAMAQDELGHSRILRALARSVDPLEAGETRPVALSGERSGWLAALAADLVADEAARRVVEAAAAGTYGPLQVRAAKVAEEEVYHRMFARRWAVRLAAGPGRGALESAVAAELGMAEDWLDQLAPLGADLRRIGVDLPSANELRAAMHRVLEEAV